MKTLLTLAFLALPLAAAAEVLGADGQFWTLKIDATTGEILAQGAADRMEEQADGQQDGGSDGETDDDGANNG